METLCKIGKGTSIVLLSAFLLGCNSSSRHGYYNASGNNGGTDDSTLTVGADTTKDVQTANYGAAEDISAVQPAQNSIKSPKQRTDNMRGFDPASEDDMDDNGMTRYMEVNDDEGWD